MVFYFHVSAWKPERDGSCSLPQGDQDRQERPYLQPGSLRLPVHSLNSLHLHGCRQQILELCPISALLQVTHGESKANI